MNKEEVLKRCDEDKLFNIVAKDCAYKAMDEYAEQMAIGFLKWVMMVGYFPKLNPDNTIPQWGWVRQENQITYSKWVSDEDVYQLYKSNL